MLPGSFLIAKIILYSVWLPWFCVYFRELFNDDKARGGGDGEAEGVHKSMIAFSCSQNFWSWLA